MKKIVQLTHGAIYQDRAGFLKYLTDAELGKTHKVVKDDKSIQMVPDFKNVSIMNQHPIDKVPSGVNMQDVMSNIMEQLAPLIAEPLVENASKKSKKKAPPAEETAPTE